VNYQGTDAALTVALAEYEELRELRRRASEDSTARVNYYIGLTTAGAAVGSALVAARAVDRAVALSAAGAIGAVLLAVGVVTFARLVRYRVHRAEYSAAIAALRSFLVMRAREVEPFMLLPRADQIEGTRRGPFATPAWAGLAMTVGLINSMSMAAIAGTVAWQVHAAPRLIAGYVLATFIVAMAGHRAYAVLRFRRAMRTVLRSISEVRLAPSLADVISANSP
jgi:hypothetical protein